MQDKHLRIYAFGKYSHRQPFAYEPIRKMLAGDVRLVQSPEQADILLLAHSKDLQAQAEFLTGFHQKNPDKKILLLSEEPFWDTIWAADPFGLHQHFTSEFGSFPFVFLNHHTSDIYDFENIPYYLLTDHRFAGRYALRFRKYARYGTSDWQQHFAKAPIQAAFIAEKRMNEKFAVRFEPQDTYGLCRFRSQVTQSYQSGQVYRAGKGWCKGPARQELADWHLDKLLTLAGRCRFVSALENTHQPAYVSEKIFDAFAVGAVPVFYASPRHRVHRLFAGRSWLNLFGLTPDQAAGAIDAFAFDPDFFDSFRQTQQKLAAIFCDPERIARERARLAEALRRALRGL